MLAIKVGIIGAAVAAGVTLPAVALSPLVDDLKIVASDPVIGDEFGSEVSILGARSVIGAPRDNIFGANSGSAYVFFKGPSGFWYEEQKITPTNATSSANFGASVGMGDGFLVVGAPVQPVDEMFRAGTAYIFAFDGTSWTQSQQLIPNDLAEKDRMGSAVAMSGDVAVIGAPGDGFFDFVTGKVFVYRKDAQGLWNYEATLTASDANNNDHFGTSVAVDGDRIVVGADRNDDAGTSSGNAYVFERQATSGQWFEVAKLSAADASGGDQFGSDVSLSGDLLAVSAFRDDDDSGLVNTGAVYLYERGTFGGWSQIQKLTAEEDMSEDEVFGSSISIVGTTLFSGAPTEASPLVSAGRVYVFEESQAAGWQRALTLTPSDGEAGDFFADSVAFDGQRAIIGSRWDDTTEPNAGSATVLSFVEECVGDINGDGTIDTADLGVLISNFGQLSIQADLNGDGIVDTADLGLLIGVFGLDCP